MPSREKSLRVHAQNAAVMPGGIASVNRSVDPPIVWEKARGAEVIDVDGTVYIDYNCAFGATILGHCHPAVNQAIRDTLDTIDQIGLGGSVLEGQLASALVKHIPSAEMVALVNSGSEATQLALRLARAATGRPRVVKFQGCYHGSYDYVAMNVISPADRIGAYDPLSAGILAEAASHTFVLPYNDCQALEDLLRERHQEIAAIILEPIQHNTGSIPATDEFLRFLREVTQRLQIVLIFDEVVTGFRHGLGGYQAICGVTPDLTTIGKAIANGFPIAALVGRRELMRRCAPPPQGDVFFAGTMNGTPALAAAALATIRQLEDPAAYRWIYHAGERMRSELQRMLEGLGYPAQVVGFGSVWLPYFLEGTISKYEDLLGSRMDLDLEFRRRMRDRSILGACTPFKRYNFCLSHTQEHLARTLQAAEDTLRELKPRL